MSGKLSHPRSQDTEVPRSSALHLNPHEAFRMRGAALQDHISDLNHAHHHVARINIASEANGQPVIRSNNL